MRIVILLTCSISLLLSAGCATRQHSSLAEGLALIAVSHALRSAVLDQEMERSSLVHSICSFHRKRDRFPSSMTELQSFVADSNGLLTLGDDTAWLLSPYEDCLRVQRSTPDSTLSYVVSADGRVVRQGKHSFRDTLADLPSSLEATKPVEPTGTSTAHD